MHLAKHILKFFGIFGVVYFVFITPQLNIGNAYAKFLRSSGEILYGNFGKNGKVMFTAYEETGSTECRTKIILLNKKHIEAAKKKDADGTVKMGFLKSSWYTDYLLVVILISLIIATPISLKRKIAALFWGLLLIHFYIALLILVQLLFEFNKNEFLQVLSLPDWLEYIVNFTNTMLSKNMGTGFVITLLIWAIVTFCKDDWKQLRLKFKV